MRLPCPEVGVALITGCSSGFGLLSALHFARAGEAVVAGVRDLSDGEPLSAARAAEGLDLRVLALDVTDATSVERAVAQALEWHGRIDVLVNNAGYGLSGAVEETTDADARALFDTNLFGPLRLLRAVLPGMRAQHSGVVVQVSSIAGRVSAPFAGVYSATKFALEAVSESLHYELRPFGIRVAIIEPGTYATGFRHNRRAAGSSGDSSPYSAVRQRWEVAAAGLPGRDQPGDPALVAAAVYDAATRCDHPLRRLVGADAELIAALRHDLDDDEFERTVRSALDFWD